MPDLLPAGVHRFMWIDSIAMATRCSLFFIDSHFNRKASLYNFDYEYSLWLESPLRLVLCIYTNQSVGKESLNVLNPMYM